MGRIGDAFRAERRDTAAAPPAGGAGTAPFDRGAAWVRDVLLPALAQADAELAGDGVAVRFDSNLDPRSTNHAHVDFWLAPRDDHGGVPHGPRHSINVREGRDVWLFRPGEPGRVLGPIEAVDAAACEEMLANAAAEYARLLG
ncbi:hypothetical protein GJ689_12130 [Rhodoplanes serenus]|uniref:Uncharacterized protein n=1 Tax=Rhodoplanes serenus TaxID=200615 RepID=A0A9X5ATE9_9BRAD|nr:hypothetical protein [Rhodoplanes serenus]MTW16953.1 hypothetical protein [Rhodoplanes serenus]